jgi:hypothetical protein
MDVVEFDDKSEIRKTTLYEKHYLVYCSDMQLHKDSILRYEDFCSRLKVVCVGKITSSYPRKGNSAGQCLIAPTNLKVG